MFGTHQSNRSFLIAVVFLGGTLTCLAQQQLVVITPPANEPYSLLKTDSPVADSLTIGSQANGQFVSGVQLILTSDSQWLSLNTDCTVPGSPIMSASTPAQVNFCVDPSQTAGNGYYVALVQVNTPDDSYPPLFVSVNLTRVPTGDLSPDPSTVTLNSNQMSVAVSIMEVTGGSAQGASVTVSAQLGQPSPEGNWLQFNLKNSKVAPGTPGEIDIQAIPANLASQASATYVHTVVLTDNFGDTKPITVTYTVQAAPTPPVRSFAHIAPQPSFATQIVLTNTGGQSVNFTLKFFHDDGTPFAVPVTTTNGTQTEDTITDSIAPFGTNYYDLSGASSAANNIWGAAQLVAPDTVAGVALFRNVPNNNTYYEAAVPLSTGSNSFVAPFDLTTSSVTGEQFVTGFAAANLDPSNQGAVNCNARDGGGTLIPNGSVNFQLKPNGHFATVLPAAFKGTRGALTCTSTTAISGISLRFQGDEFTTLPVVIIP